MFFGKLALNTQTYTSTYLEEATAGVLHEHLQLGVRCTHKLLA